MRDFKVHFDKRHPFPLFYHHGAHGLYKMKRIGKRHSDGNALKCRCIYKFINGTKTFKWDRAVCAPSSREAAKRLKHCNNASKLENRLLKVTIEYSLSCLAAPSRPI